MTRILLIGRDAALLEGVAQVLAAEGYRTMIATTVADAAEAVGPSGPLVAVVERELLAAASALPLRVAQGGAVVVYHVANGETGPLPLALQRTVLAEVTLPLERHRLLTLIQRVDARARASGRNRTDTPPEHRAY